MKKLIFKLTPENHRRVKLLSIRTNIPYQYFYESFTDFLLSYDTGERKNSSAMSAIVSRAQALKKEKKI